ncbi:MAG: EamA family transporter [Bacteroidota bacterium]
MLKSLVLILTSVSLGVCGQLAIKLGINRAGDLQALMGHSLWRFVSAVAGSPLIMSGLVLYGISTIFWFLVLSRVDLSLAYPMLSLGYIGILFVSSVFLGEKVTLLRWSGTVLIVLGVVLTASTAKTP